MKGGGKWADGPTTAADDMRFRPALLQSLAVFLVSSCNAAPTEPANGGGVGNEMVPGDAIVITDTGSTNMLGYRIVIGRNGEASYESGEGHGSARLPASTFSRLKYDVAMAQPLSHVKASADCMKPMSFGSSTFVALADEKTEDLTCPASPKGEALKGDVEAVTQFLHVRNVPRGKGHEFPPQNY
jgi:hypothetical protein